MAASPFILIAVVVTLAGRAVSQAPPISSSIPSSDLDGDRDNLPLLTTPTPSSPTPDIQPSFPSSAESIFFPGETGQFHFDAPTSGTDSSPSAPIPAPGVVDTPAQPGPTPAPVAAADPIPAPDAGNPQPQPEVIAVTMISFAGHGGKPVLITTTVLPGTPLALQSRLSITRSTPTGTDTRISNPSSTINTRKRTETGIGALPTDWVGTGEGGGPHGPSMTAVPKPVAVLVSIIAAVGFVAALVIWWGTRRQRKRANAQNTATATEDTPPPPATPFKQRRASLSSTHSNETMASGMAAVDGARTPRPLFESADSEERGNQQLRKEEKEMQGSDLSPYPDTEIPRAIQFNRFHPTHYALDVPTTARI